MARYRVTTGTPLASSPPSAPRHTISPLTRGFQHTQRWQQRQMELRRGHSVDSWPLWWQHQALHTPHTFAYPHERFVEWIRAWSSLDHSHGARLGGARWLHNILSYRAR
jgi:hypothetical protein